MGSVPPQGTPSGANGRSHPPFGGGVAVPTGAFGDVHGQGTQGSASLLVRLASQRVRLRPEIGVARFGIESTAAGSVDPLAASPSALRALGRVAGQAQRAGAEVASRDIASTSRHTTRLSALANLELPVAGGNYLVGAVGLARVRTTDATAGDDFTANALTCAGGIGWRMRLGRVEGFVEARLQRLSIKAGRAYCREVQAAPISIGWSAERVATTGQPPATSAGRDLTVAPRVVRPATGQER